jgi:hypothetical protein
MPTPVDLSAYTQARAQTEEVERRVANGGSIIVRRPVIEMPRSFSFGAPPSGGAISAAEPAAAAALSSTATPAGETPAAATTASAPGNAPTSDDLDFSLDRLDDASPLDVPAFLRR